MYMNTITTMILLEEKKREMWIYSGEKQSCPLSPLLFELRWVMRESIEKLKLESIEKLKLNIGV